MKLAEPRLPITLDGARVARLVAKTIRDLEGSLSAGAVDELLVFGGAAVAIYLAELEGSFRNTKDIDVDQTPLSNLQHADAELDVQQKCIEMWTIAPDFRACAVDVTDLIGTDNVTVRLVHPYDLLILKMARLLPRDYEDCTKLVSHGFIPDWEALDERLYNSPTKTTLQRMNFEEAYNDLFNARKLPPEVLRLYAEP